MQQVIGLIKNYQNKTRIHIAAVLLFGYVSLVLPIQIIGLPSAFDMVTDMRFASSFQDAFASGHLFPSWANDNFGYGSIGIRFYPPLSLFLLAVTQSVINDWFTALTANLFFWLFVGCLGVYLFVRTWGTPGQGLLAACLYAIVPRHVGEVFQAFAFAEFAAWGILPFCFLFVTRICRGGTRKDTILFAVSYSLLILTHIPTTIIASFCLPVYVLSVMDWRNFKKIFVSLLSALAFTLLATSFRSVIVLNELGWVQHNDPENYGSGFYNFNSWLFPNVMVQHSFIFLNVAAWLFDITTVLTLAFTIPAFIYLFTSSTDKLGSNRKVLFASLITVAFSFFMLSRLSYHVWDNIVILQKTQFPTRWLSVVSLFCVVSFSLSAPILLKRFPKFRRLVIYPGLALVVAILIFNVGELIIPCEPLSDDEMTQITVQMKAEPIWKSWWPTWANKKAFDVSDRVLAGGRAFEVTSWHAESKEFTVQPGKAQSVVVKSFYYPLWKASVNGQPVEPGIGENGVMTIPISAESSQVRLDFHEPNIYIVANAFSLVTWLVLLGYFAVAYGRNYLPTVSRSLSRREYDYS